jgi:lambda family phage portal protein
MTFRQKLARWIGGKPAPKLAVRQYSAARIGRTSTGFAPANTSADAELSQSLTNLRARSRQMVRDNPYAKRAKTLIVNNVIGSGVPLQAQVMTTRDDLAKRVNDEIEMLWCEWACADSCHTGGKLHFHDLERAGMGEVFEAGEVLIRMHFRRFGESKVPLALELIEAERLASEFDVISTPSGNDVRMGIEADRFGRPVAYYLRTRHPGDRRFSAGQREEFERVPAEEIFHLHLVDRWPQTRGVPWMHTVLAKLDMMNEYSQAEVQAARDSAFYFATISRTPDVDGPGPLANEGAGTGVGDQSAPPAYAIESGVIQELEPGETLDFHAPNRPNTAIDAFLRYMLREIAAGVGPSYAALSQDYSQSNYSSSRLAMLDDRDSWRALQSWWIRSFRLPLHRWFMQQAALSGALATVPMEQYGPNRRKFEAVLFKPRGWSWVNPVQEVDAFKEAVKAGFMTVTDVIAATAGGMDIEDVVATRKRELAMLAENGIEVDTTVKAEAPPPPAPPPDPPDDDEQQDEPPARLVSFRR